MLLWSSWSCGPSDSVVWLFSLDAVVCFAQEKASITRVLRPLRYDAGVVGPLRSSSSELSVPVRACGLKCGRLCGPSASQEAASCSDHGPRPGNLQRLAHD